MDSLSNAATVLVIDDNEVNRALARATLEDENCRVLEAEDGERGIATFERERPDCVLLDVRMPGTDGFAVCTRIRALPGGANVPIIFLTALRDVDTFDRAQAAGGDDFLTKPVSPAELVARVRTAIDLRRTSALLREHYDIVKKQRDDLLRLQLQKQRLSAFLVHDLKNPVSVMDLHAQVLLRDPTLSDTARSSATHIRQSARSLLQMILNLLDISKAEEGQLEPKLETIDLDALTTAIADDFAVKALESSVVLRRTIGAKTVRADAALFRRIVENLVENAVRHAPKGTAVHIETISREGAVELRVSDEGRGVPPEMRDKVFDAFVQVAEGRRTVSRAGRGLGLSFCKMAVLAHHGRIWIEDAAPGAIVCVSLPA